MTFFRVIFVFDPKLLRVNSCGAFVSYQRLPPLLDAHVYAKNNNNNNNNNNKNITA
ncbi:hypothetical protein ACMBCN_01260 [Candidatus Liberibacter asiaticus]|nr:hypothetical protein [Candidatus Liberibacter asiaticus]